MVILGLFGISTLASTTEEHEPSVLLNVPPLVTDIFLQHGVALTLITIIVGQLCSQINAAKYMLDFVNNYPTVGLVTIASLAIESSGVLHCVYLARYLLSYNMIQKETNEEETKQSRSLAKTIFFWGRVILSVCLLGYAMTVTIVALEQGETAMWEGVPVGFSMLLFFILIMIVGLLEGLQIALFSVLNDDVPHKERHQRTQAVCDLAFRDSNLEAFLIGRQICVTLCMFIIARVTSLTVEVGTDENILDVSDGIQHFFNTGLLGALLSTILASLIWRVVASAAPYRFLSNPILYFLIRICLLLEASGVCYAAWILARGQQKCLHLQTDEVYLVKHNSNNEEKGDSPTERSLAVCPTHEEGSESGDLVLVEEGNGM